jgi:heat shock protein HslJ
MHSARRSTAILGVVVCALAVSATVSGCTAHRPTAGASDPDLRGSWVLTGGQDGYGAMNLLNQDITLTVSDSSVSTGRGSCSDYTATIYGSERSLWVTTTAPQSFSCATADQSVLQLEYLNDLAAVQHSAITARGLELIGTHVTLSFVRATELSLRALVGRTWELTMDGTINLHGPLASSAQSGGYIRFESETSLSAVTRCVRFTANYRQDGDDLVTGRVMATNSLGCDRAGDKAATDFARIFDGGFRFGLAGNSLHLTSSRAGITLGFSELGTP